MKTAKRDKAAAGQAEDESPIPLSGFGEDSFHLQKNLRNLIQTLIADPNADVADKIEEAVDIDFPLVHYFPTSENVDDAVLNEPPDSRLKFEQGQWCEYHGLDMQWHLTQIKRVVKVAPDRKSVV